MRLKTYQARSIADALAKVKKDLGRNAVILHTRTLTRGGVLGIGARSIVEITATNDERVMHFRKAANDGVQRDELPTPRNSARLATAPREAVDLTQERAQAESVPRGELRGLGKAISAAAEGEAASTSRAVSAGATGTLEPRASVPTTGVEGRLRRELNEIRDMVHDLVRRARKDERPTDSELLLDYHAHLLSQEVNDELAAEIVRNAEARLEQVAKTTSSRVLDAQCNADALPPDRILDELRQVITEMLPSAAPLRLRDDGRPTVVALVGPTGVGKTTTIAKLAANMKLRENKRVGLITIDSYRIAAIEQLKTYAQILQVPIVSVLKPADMREAIERMADLDLILIDTAGRSQKDGLRIAELHEFLQASNPDQTHLVLSTTSREKTIREAIDRFGALGVGHLIFTKLDEAEGLGVILNVLRDNSLRLSYLTNGQAVPDDIEIGSASRVARLVLSGSESGPRLIAAAFEPSCETDETAR